MNLQERRTADRKLSESRRNARENYLSYKRKSSQSDLEYRKTKARVFAEMKANGATDKAADLECEAQAAEHKRDRDLHDALAKSALLRIEELERDAVTVRDVHQSSERIDGLAA